MVLFDTNDINIGLFKITSKLLVEFGVKDVDTNLNHFQPYTSFKTFM